ncbi:MAG TPA: DsbA family protein [Solirubrobacteraceae bacterium]|nr:DsbA family protein [Solirubrobacteraceae bacterium]
MAERSADVLGVVPEWEPVVAADLPGGADAFRCAEEAGIFRAEIERRAAAQRVQPVRWPAGWPGDPRPAMLVATYARQLGRTVAFSLAAFRQAFAAGRDLSTPDGVIVAAAACEMHPRAVLQALEMRTVAAALDATTRGAAEAGVTRVPAIRLGEDVFEGPDAPEQAARALAATAGAARSAS